MSEKYLVRKSDVYQIAWEMLREHQVDMVISLGDASLLGGIHAWNEFDGPAQGDTVKVITGDPSPVASLASDHAKVDVEVEPNWKNLWGVLTLETAKRIILDCAKDAARTVGTLALNTAKVRVEQKIGHKLDFTPPGEKRWELFQQRYKFRMQVHRNTALKKLAAVVFDKHSGGRRRGIQILSTRKLIVPLGFSVFCGKPCYRAGVGRQSLPKGVWLNRYRARRLKQRKDPARKYSMKKRGAVKIPVPRVNRRPKHVMNLKPSKLARGSFYVTTEDADLLAGQMIDSAEDITLS